MTDLRIEDTVDLERYPIADPESPATHEFVEGCRAELDAHGMLNLEGFLNASAASKAVAELVPRFEAESFLHARHHNIYFDPDVSGIDPGHPALKELETVNHTLTADQITGSLVDHLYEWPPLRHFIAATLGKPRLHLMADPLARINVMAYRDGEALNWHFDRSEFTTTLILQTPEAGGEFQYRSGLRSAADPNYDGVARLLVGEDRDVSTATLPAGTLSLFKGRNTAHRVTPVTGGRSRMVAVFSYYETPGIVFSEAERVGFYGRSR